MPEPDPAATAAAPDVLTAGTAGQAQPGSFSASTRTSTDRSSRKIARQVSRRDHRIRHGRTPRNYPQPGDRFLTPTHRLAGSIRALQRAFVVIVAAGILAMVAALQGWSLGPFATWIFAFPALSIMLHGQTDIFRSLYARIDETTRKTWEKVHLPFGDLIHVRDIDMTPAEYQAYRTVLAPPAPGPDAGKPVPDRSLNRWEAPDLRSVAWLKQHDITPHVLAEYRAARCSAADVPALHEYGLTPAHIAAAHLGRETPATTIRLLDHLRTGRATLHPLAFTAEHDEAPRSIDDAVEFLADLHRATKGRVTAQHIGDLAWREFEIKHGQIRSSRSAFSVRRPPVPALPVAECFDSRRVYDQNRRDYNGNPIGVTMGEWVRVAGSLTPHFLDAGLTFDEAEHMLATSNGDITRETLQTQAALRRL